jgi:hypothetical protein
VRHLVTELLVLLVAVGLSAGTCPTFTDPRAQPPAFQWLKGRGSWSRLQFSSTSRIGYCRLRNSHAGPKCLVANARPDPDFKYFSKRRASFSVGNSKETTTDQGR